MEKTSSSLSPVQTTETPYLYAVGLCEDELKIVPCMTQDQEEAEAYIIDKDLFLGGAYQFCWSRYKNLSATTKMREQLMKEGT